VTIDSKAIIVKMLQNNGVYPGDPQAVSIWSYRSAAGRLTQAVFMHENHDMYSSSYVSSPVLLWHKESGLTEYGRTWLKDANEADCPSNTNKP
jgi:hypothetical protein